MSLQEAAEVLENLARRAWQRQALRWAALVLAVVVPVTVGAGVVWGWSPGVQGIVGVVLMAVGMALGLPRLRRSGIDAARVAAHLDRTTATLEESTALLLQSPEALPLVQRLQQRRVLDAFGQLPSPLPAPAKGLRRAGLMAVASVLFSMAVAAWVPRPFADGQGAGIEPMPLHPVADSSAEQTPVRVEAARVTVTPPSYTGRAPFTGTTLNLEALQHARAAWAVTLNQPVARAVLVFSDGDTLALQPDEANTYRAGKPLRYSGFYFLEATSTGLRRYRSDYYAIAVTEDMPPLFTVMQPEMRTVIEPGQPAQIALNVQADDDIGLNAARLVATVSKGSGENVKFREQALDFDAVTKTSSTRWTLAGSLDLDALGMEMGDELFLFVEGWDNRAPEPNRGRSETFVVVLKDTAQWADVSSLGLALSPAEEYLRSQRQIIIDTEKLIADTPDLTQEVFRQRSNNIGIDQKLLRLQYGQFLGEEFESTVTEAERFLLDHDGESEHDHEGDDHAGEAAVESSPDAAAAIIEQYGHTHDTEEGATFYSEDIKRELKAALAEMWEAELHLRTFRPETALPYEYRALRILKALQQKARIYVKRIGFEPPPINPEEARLTGDLDAVQSRRVRRDARAEISFPAIREALVLLSTLEESPDEMEASVTVLEQAGSELAGVAVDEAGRYLAALQALRTLIDGLDASGTVCRVCIPTVRRAFWTVLPPADALPTPRRDAGTSLARRYFNHLGR